MSLNMRARCRRVVELYQRATSASKRKFYGDSLGDASQA